jgi:hypothetical protein
MTHPPNPLLTGRPVIHMPSSAVRNAVTDGLAIISSLMGVSRG